MQLVPGTQALPSVSQPSPYVPIEWANARDLWAARLDNPRTRKNYKASVGNLFTSYVDMNMGKDKEHPDLQRMPQFVCDVTAEHVEAWRNDIVERAQRQAGQVDRISPMTVNRHIAAIRNFFDYWRSMSARDRKLYVCFGKETQLQILKPMKASVTNPYGIISDEEIAPLLNAARQREPITTGADRLSRDGDRRLKGIYKGKDALLALRDEAIVQIATAGGLRVSEVAHLRVGDLQQGTYYEAKDILDDHGQPLLDDASKPRQKKVAHNCWYLHISMTKGNVSRDVPLADGDAQVILDYLTATGRAIGHQEDRELPMWHGRGIHNEGISVDHTRLIINAAIDRTIASGHISAGRNLSPHALRHSYAVRLMHEGLSLAEIQALLGHKNIATTQRYLQHTETMQLAPRIPSIADLRK